MQAFDDRLPLNGHGQYDVTHLLKNCPNHIFEVG